VKVRFFEVCAFQMQDIIMIPYRKSSHSSDILCGLQYEPKLKLILLRPLTDNCGHSNTIIEGYLGTLPKLKYKQQAKHCYYVHTSQVHKNCSVHRCITKRRRNFAWTTLDKSNQSCTQRDGSLTWSSTSTLRYCCSLLCISLGFSGKFATISVQWI